MNKPDMEYLIRKLNRMFIKLSRLTHNYVDIPPTTADSKGKKGQWSMDDDYYYKCVEDNKWKRSMLTTF